MRMSVSVDTDMDMATGIEREMQRQMVIDTGIDNTKIMLRYIYKYTEYTYNHTM